ncbi:MAG: radical SAM protein [Thermoguttaceae bacterium]
MPILKTLTLGCKVNQYETEYLRQGLARLGYRDARDGETADLGVVNTCTVTIEAEAKSRKLIRRFARQNPRAEIIVMGCYATRAAAEAARLPGVVEVVADKRQLPEVLARRGLVDIPTGISSFGRRHRAYVKVQDGCRMGCSYCIIPSVRPTLASRPVEEVLAEVRRLADGGHREIVLTGIHLGHYGLDFGDGRWNLARLLRTVVATGGSRVEGPESRAQARAGAITPLSPCGRGAGGEGDVAGATAGSPSSAKDTVGQANRGTQSTFADVVREPHQDFRVRLSSIEAAEVTPELLNFLAEFPQRACPHLHISMQSGSDAVLARMRRRWPVRQFIERCHEVTRRLDKPALTTDVIVGFPGETEEDFLATCRAVSTAAPAAWRRSAGGCGGRISSGSQAIGCKCW